MSKLSEIVQRDYVEELNVIKATGDFWSSAIGLPMGFVLLCVFDYLIGRPWDRKDITYAVLASLVGPFIIRAWKRHQVTSEMKHQRQVRIEAKLDALLGLINIKD